MRSALTAHVLPTKCLFLAAFPVHGRSLGVRCGGSLDLVSLIPYQYGTASQYNLSVTSMSIKSKHNTTHPNNNGRPIFHPKARHNHPSHRPRPPPHRNRPLQRTLSILLNAPIYYGGTQATLGPPSQIQFWVSLFSHRPPQIPSDTYFINNILKTRLNGYSAVTDSPCNGLIPELLDLYPKAVVICTLRDPDAWVRSKETVSSAALLCLRALLDTRYAAFPYLNQGVAKAVSCALWSA